MGVRDDARTETTARILAAARSEIAERGGGGLSMRAVAREVGLVSSAIYRYFPTREALLTAMIVESYGRLADALGRVDGGGPAERWHGLGEAFRSWATRHPHEFQLIYGTPIPGYVAPPETVPAAASVVSPFLAVGAHADVQGFDGTALHEQLAEPAAGFDVAPDQLAAVLAEVSALVGFVSLELAGHLVGTADPGDPLYEALLDRQLSTLCLPAS